jgi:hypothetical protein
MAGVVAVLYLNVWQGWLQYCMAGVVAVLYGRGCCSTVQCMAGSFAALYVRGSCSTVYTYMVGVVAVLYGRVGCSWLCIIVCSGSGAPVLLY